MKPALRDGLSLKRYMDDAEPGELHSLLLHILERLDALEGEPMRQATEVEEYRKLAVGRFKRDLLELMAKHKIDAIYSNTDGSVSFDLASGQELFNFKTLFPEDPDA